MNTKIFFIALIAFLGFSQVGKAGVILFVHFGDTDVLDQQDLVTTFPPNSLSNQVTANIYLHLTGGSTLYGYRFSVRYDSDALLFNSRSQENSLFARDPNVEYEGGQSPEPLPVNPSKAPSLVENGMDLYRFNGLTAGLNDFGGTGFYKLATLSFTFADPQQDLQGRKLIEPGKFEFSPNDVQLRDTVLTGDLDVNGDVQIYDFKGGSNSSSGGTVPEPASAIVFVALGALVLLKRKHCLFAKNCA